jgi:RNA polymerase sigma-70 factor (ECF subfamily)
VSDNESNNEDLDRRDIKACIEGDKNSFAKLVRRYQEPVTNLMWRFTRDKTLLEELVQDVFVEAYLSLPGYRSRAPFLHWLRAIGSRVGYRFWKKQKADNHIFVEDYSGADKADSTEDSKSAGMLVYSLLARLPRADRLVLTLIYFDDCSIEEIARRMGWTRAMVKMRAYRARKKMKTIIEKEKLLEKF